MQNILYVTCMRVCVCVCVGACDYIKFVRAVIHIIYQPAENDIWRKCIKHDKAIKLLLTI